MPVKPITAEAAQSRIAAHGLTLAMALTMTDSELLTLPKIGRRTLAYIRSHTDAETLRNLRGTLASASKALANTTRAIAALEQAPAMTDRAALALLHVEHLERTLALYYTEQICRLNRAKKRAEGDPAP